MSGGLTSGRWTLVALLAAAGALTIPAIANAAIRYAAPGGTAMAAQCTSQATPCTIYEASQGAGVVAGDEVVIVPGNYSDTAGDLGPSHYVDPVANTIHGEAGSPRPVITLDDASNGGFGAFKVETGNTISHLEIDSTDADTNIDLAGGTVDDLIARSGASASAPIVCRFTGTAILRDSACISAADQARTVGSFLSSGTATATLRNVTAVATGGISANAIDFAALNTATLNLDAKSVIGQATGAGVDLYAEEYGSSTVTYTIDHSNYSGFGSQGSPTVNATNTQIADPTLAADSVHQLPASVTVNAGAAVDGSSGSADIDGQARAIGTPDIGADELGHPTSTTVSCTPASVPVGSSTSCTGTVADTAPTAPTPPTGTVTFASDTAGGTLSSGGTCALLAVNSTTAGCSLTYTPGEIGSGMQQITAEYGADTTHDLSQDFATVEVFLTAPPPPSSVTPQTSADPCPSLLKRLKKAKKAHDKSQIRKLRKKLRNLCGIR
jgi:hypothetical protein